jgi:hypothetical protein
VYHGRPALRWLVYLGTLGLAALAPGRERLPVWVVLGLGCAPIFLLELGAELAMTSTAGRRRAGARMQLAGALIYLALLAAALGATRSPRLHGFPFLVALASLGGLASGVVLWDHARRRQGQLPVAAGERMAAARAGTFRGLLADALAIIGGTPIAVGALSLGMVAMAVAVIPRRHGRVPLEMALGLGFFTGCALMALAQALGRWEALVPHSRVKGPLTAVQSLAFLLFGGSMAGMGWLWLRDPAGSRFMAILGISFGALGVAAGLAWPAARRGGGRAGYDLVREGLLERTRGGPFLYPWAAIESVALGEFQHRISLLVRLADPALIEGPVGVTAGGGDRAMAARLARRKRSLRWNRNLFDAEVIVLGHLGGAPIGALFRTAEAAITDAEARAALPPAAERLARAVSAGS